MMGFLIVDQCTWAVAFPLGWAFSPVMKIAASHQQSLLWLITPGSCWCEAWEPAIMAQATECPSSTVLVSGFDVAPSQPWIGLWGANQWRELSLCLCLALSASVFSLKYIFKNLFKKKKKESLPSLLQEGEVLPSDCACHRMLQLLV